MIFEYTTSEQGLAFLYGSKAMWESCEEFYGVVVYGPTRRGNHVVDYFLVDAIGLGVHEPNRDYPEPLDYEHLEVFLCGPTESRRVQEAYQYEVHEYIIQH